MTNQDTVYLIYENGECITDAYSREDAIKQATKYFEQRLVDDGFTGELQKDILLVIGDNEEIKEKITLDIIIEYDNYDGGRFDYLNSRI